MPALECSVMKKCYGNFWNIKSSFWKADNGNNICFWVVFPGQKWSDLCWLGTFIDEPNKWKRGFSEELVSKSKIMTICAVTDMMGISIGWVQRILRDNLNMHWNATKFTLHILRLKTNDCHFTPSPLTRFSTVTSYFSQNSKWHFSKGDLISPWHKQNRGTCLLSFKQFT